MYFTTVVEVSKEFTGKDKNVEKNVQYESVYLVSLKPRIAEKCYK